MAISNSCALARHYAHNAGNVSPFHASLSAFGGKAGMGAAARIETVPETGLPGLRATKSYLPPQYDQLTPEQRVLCLKSALRLERRGEQDQEE
jgi:hypothetical protein